VRACGMVRAYVNVCRTSKKTCSERTVPLIERADLLVAPQPTGSAPGVVVHGCGA
jgi:hypothetical protein